MPGPNTGNVSNRPTPLSQEPRDVQIGLSNNHCPYCRDASPPPEQFYETKFFRVLIARSALVEGHTVIMPKDHNPHFYTLTLDELEEFGYLMKKVSFWSMRYTRNPSFTAVMSDGTAEVAQTDHLQVHILPRSYMNTQQLEKITQAVAEAVTVLDDAQVVNIVKELKNLMQLPQQVE